MGNGLTRRNKRTKANRAIKKMDTDTVELTAKHRFPVFDLDSLE